MCIKEHNATVDRYVFLFFLHRLLAAEPNYHSTHCDSHPQLNFCDMQITYGRNERGKLESFKHRD